MKHYFKIQNIPEKTQRKGIFSIFLSNLGVTGWLIIFNVIFFILTLVLYSIFGETLVNNYLALKSANLFNHSYIWTLVTSMFMHAGFVHLLVNMVSLFFLGRFLEILIGKKRYFLFYLSSGIFAGIFFACFSYFFGNYSFLAKLFGSPEIYAVGASGAIFGIAGLLAFLTPRNKVYLLAGPLIAIIGQLILEGFNIPGSFLNIVNFIVMVYIFICIFSMFSFNPKKSRIALPINLSFWLIPLVAIVPLIILGLFIPLPIGNMAHLGGYIAGMIYGLYLKSKYKNKTRIIADYFSE